MTRTPYHVLSRRALLGSAVLGFGALGLAASTGRARAQSPAGKPVTIANASGLASFTIQEVLRQQGYMEEFGLKPETLNIGDGGKIVGGIIGGNIDVSMLSGFAQIFPAIERGAQLKVIGGGGMLPWQAVFTSKPEVRTLKDLEGKTVGTGSLGALLHQLMVALLQKHQVDVTKVRFVNIGGSVDIFRAVTAGTVDAGPGDLSLIDQQDEFKVRLLEYGNMAEELPEYTYQGTWTSARMIESKRDVIVRSMAAYAKLYRFVQSPNSQEAFVRAQKTLFPRAPEDQAVTQWKYIQKYKTYNEALVVSEERVNYMQNLNIEVKSQRKVLPYAQIVDMSLAKEALAMLG